MKIKSDGQTQVEHMSFLVAVMRSFNTESRQKFTFAALLLGILALFLAFYPRFDPNQLMFASLLIIINLVVFVNRVAGEYKEKT